MPVPESQTEVAAFLCALTGSDRAETHISAIFVGPHDVYKLKKAVRLSFLDFTSLQTRAAMARREFQLNHVAAPDIYRGVRAIVRAPDGTLRLADDGAPDAIDYVVHMAPIAAGDFLDDIVARNDLTPALLDALGDCVADLHARLPPVTHWDSPRGMRHIIDGNSDAAHAAGLDSKTVTKWYNAIRAELHRIGPALTARAAQGCVKRLHGDLHLGNICLWHGKPTAFDMLEFDEALATADIGYDLAFLLMDLSIHAGQAAANRVMNRYIARTGDAGLLAALPCFISIRAIVRGHVQASRDRRDDAAGYLRLALDSLRPQPPFLVAIGGLQGTGKTTLARALAPNLGRAPGACVLRSDEIRKRLFDALPEQTLPPEAYAPGANARTNTALLAGIATALQAGQAVIADSTFLHEPLRHAAEAAARAAHAPFIGFWLEADVQTLLARVAARTHDASDAGPDIVRQAATADPGRITWHRMPGDADEARAILRKEGLLF
jgi:aminoglycoside phosphotransferase family enzyme/predicted kinase